MAQNWNLLGSNATVPLYITGSGAMLQEELFLVSASVNSLSEYQTTISVANNGFDSGSVIKTSAGQIYKILAQNFLGAGAYLMLFNTGSVPPGGFRPSGSFYVAPSGTLDIDYRSGKTFNAGITVAWSNTFSSFTGTAAGIIDIFYK